MTHIESIESAVRRYCEHLTATTGHAHEVSASNTRFWQIVRSDKCTVEVRVGRSSGVMYDPVTGFPCGAIEKTAARVA